MAFHGESKYDRPANPRKRHHMGGFDHGSEVHWLALKRQRREHTGTAARRLRFGLGSSVRRGSHMSKRRGSSARSSYGLGHSTDVIRSFSMRPKDAGTKIVRCYEAQFNVQNSANSNDGQGYSLLLVNTAGTIDLKWQLGSSGAATTLATFEDFPEECKCYIDVFRWMKVLGMEMELIPISNVVTNEDSSVSDMSLENDPGIIRLFPWDGDQDMVSTAGLYQFDWNEAQRQGPGVHFNPIGGHSVRMAKIPQQWTVQPDGTPVPSTTPMNKWAFPRAAPIDTQQIQSAGAQQTYYGFAFFWQHPNLTTNSGKVKFTCKVRVKVQWNTLYDAEVAASKVAKRQEFLSQYDPLQCYPNLASDDGPDDFMTDADTELKDLKLYDQKKVQQNPQQPLPATPQRPPIVRGNSPMRQFK